MTNAETNTVKKEVYLTEGELEKIYAKGSTPQRVFDRGLYYTLKRK